VAPPDPVVLVEPGTPPVPVDAPALVVVLDVDAPELVVVLDVAAPPDPVVEVEATEVLDPDAPA
jgi:hypothetical protein